MYMVADDKPSGAARCRQGANAMATKRKTLSLETATATILPASGTEPARILPDTTGTIGPAAPALSVSAVAGGAWAGNTAAEIAEDATFEADMLAAVDADEVSRRKVYTVLNDLYHIFDKEDLIDWPRLSPTLAESKKLPVGTNIPFLAEYETTKKNKDGKDISGTGNRYDDLARGLPWVKAWIDHKAYCVEARKDRTKAREEHFNWSSYRWDAEINKYAKRINNGISMIKMAVKVHFQSEEINRLPQIGCGLMTGTDTAKLIEVGEPMAIWSKVEKDELTKQPLSTCLSSAAFLALKPAVALAKANLDPAAVTYAMLLASAGRTKTGTKTGTTEPAIKDMNSLEGTLAELLRFMAQEHNAAKLRTMIAGKDKKGQPLMSDDYIVTINNLAATFDAVVTFPEFAARVQTAINNVSQRQLRERGITPQAVGFVVPVAKAG